MIHCYKLPKQPKTCVPANSSDNILPIDRQPLLHLPGIFSPGAISSVTLKSQEKTRSKTDAILERC